MIHKNTNTILLVSESSYPGGGGEEFLLDIANYFNNNNYTVYWMTLHDWGKSVHSTYIEIVKQSYTEIQMPRSVDDMSNYNYLLDKIKQFNINFILHQGQMHKTYMRYRKYIKYTYNNVLVLLGRSIEYKLGLWISRNKKQFRQA